MWMKKSKIVGFWYFLVLFGTLAKWKAVDFEQFFQDFTEQTKSSSEAFERYRQTLGAQHGPLFRRFTALLNGERGTSGSVCRGSPGLLTATVSAMVQLADLRLQNADVGASRNI